MAPEYALCVSGQSPKWCWIRRPRSYTWTIVETLAQTRTNTASTNDLASATPAPRTVRIAYLLSQYPAISHTFFLHEVLGLRARGLHIETASINAPDRALDQLPANEAAEARTTQYIKQGSKLGMLRTVAGVALTRPGVLLRGIKAVLGIEALTVRHRGFWLFYLLEAILVGAWMQERRLNHLHVHFGGPVASVGMLTSIAWQIPYSLTIHGPEELLNVDACQLRAKLMAASFVICISDFCRSQLCQLTPPEIWSRFTVVRLGVDPFLLKPVTRPADAAEPLQRPIELVCTGRLVAAKGHHILIDALAVLHARGIAVHTTLIGAGPERTSLERAVEQRGLTHAVTFKSALAHAATLDHLRKADLFVLASFAEGIPVALMEAMSLSIPCISTTIAGIPELIQSGRDGILVPPANSDALVEAIGSLAADPTLRRRLGSCGRQRIIADYNLPLNQERLARCFEQRVAPAYGSGPHS